MCQFVCFSVAFEMCCATYLSVKQFLQRTTFFVIVLGFATHIFNCMFVCLWFCILQIFIVILSMCLFIILSFEMCCTTYLCFQLFLQRTTFLSFCCASLLIFSTVCLSVYGSVIVYFFITSTFALCVCLPLSLCGMIHSFYFPFFLQTTYNYLCFCCALYLSFCLFVCLYVYFSCHFVLHHFYFILFLFVCFCSVVVLLCAAFFQSYVSYINDLSFNVQDVILYFDFNCLEITVHTNKWSILFISFSITVEAI